MPGKWRKHLNFLSKVSHLAIRAILMPVLYLSIFTYSASIANSSTSANIVIRFGILDMGPPEAVTDLAVSTTTIPLTVRLSWTAPQEDPYPNGPYPVTIYDVRWSTNAMTGDTTAWWNNANPVESGPPQFPGNKETMNISGLIPGVAHYFAIRSGDELSNPSDISNIATITPVGVPLMEPLGLKSSLVDNGTHVAIEWKPVTKCIDNSLASWTLAGYNIYRSGEPNGEYSLKGSVSKNILIWTDPENINGKIYYYLARAVDVFSKESKNSMIVDSSIDNNIIAQTEDGTTRIAIPSEISDILYESGEYKEDLKIDVERKIGEETGRVLRSCNFTIKKGESNETIKNFAFKEPKATIVFTYKINPFGMTEFRNIQASQAKKQFAIFRYNGLEWLKLGGLVDENTYTVTVKTRQLGTYRLQESLRHEFSLTYVIPRIFTPGDDMWNKVVRLHFDNPYDKQCSAAKIFDIRGALVRDLTLEIEYTPGAAEICWDGKDENGNIVPSGVYIYQIETDKEVINGTIVVAR